MSVVLKNGFPFVPYAHEAVDPEEMLARADAFYAEMDRRRSVRDFSDEPARALSRWGSLRPVSASGAVPCPRSHVVRVSRLGDWVGIASEERAMSLATGACAKHLQALWTATDAQ